MKWVLKFVLLVNILLVIATLLAYLSPFVNPSKTWFFSFFGLGYPILLMLNMLFIIFWMMIKPKHMLFSIAVLLIGYKAIARTVGLNLPSDNMKGVTVMSYNIGHSRYLLDGKNSRKIKNQFKNFITTENPDIICIQERIRVHQDFYDDIFTDYTIYPNEFIGTAVYSKWPVTDHGNIYFDTNAHNASWADIIINGKKLRVYSIHLSSNKVKKMSDDIKEMWDESKFILDKYNFHAKIRTDQIDQIIRHSSKLEYPVIIAGDFNDVPQSYLYRKVSKSFKDAFIDNGSGLIKTHNSFMPGLRIDYTFHSQDIKATAQKILKKKFSDHYALITSFNID